MSSLWIKVQTTIVDNPKIIGLSDKGFRAFIEMMIYSQQHLSDGFIDGRVARSKWGEDVLNELMTNDKNNPSLIAVEDGYALYNYTKYQTSASKVEEIRERAKKAGKQSAAKRAVQRDVEQPVERVVEQPVQPDTEVDTEVDIKRATRINENWNLDDSLLAWTRETAPNLNIVFEREKFVDYWLSKSGKDATKTDWGRTWKNWVRSNVERNPSLATKPVQSDPNDWMIAQRIELT